RYDAQGPKILDGINLVVEAGEFVALVGPSGSGKTTILRLLLGFEQPEAGSIRYDDMDLADLDAPMLRRKNFGVVLQQGGLLPGSILSNVVGLDGHDEKQAWAVLREAGLAEDIAAMPQGLHTAVGEGGSTLSGGQRQRLTIARALAGKPSILFLDEATSALDNRTQDIVVKSLESLRVTRIVVAHRLSTVQNADRIVLLDGGKIVESGTYRELMAREGRFRELVRRQLLAR
ncbi:MAG: ATP-binding cassette domain-containing protein, partial [Opitutae bacterium]|nr:ATP-binding cassette domain-containing protein [Opitutae bacterium]